MIKDIIHRITERFPLKLFIFPANVQGSNCLNDILKGLDYFDNITKEDPSSVDVVIIARGGGSLEDLMAFNEELLVKKIFEVNIPIISAVGHETDFTLCDLKAEAPNPSNMTEMAVPDRKDLILRLNDWLVSFRKTFLNIFENKFLNFKLTSERLPDFNEKINNYFQVLDYADQKLEICWRLNCKMKDKLYKTIEKFSVNKFEKLIQSAVSLILINTQKLKIFMDKDILIKKEKLKSLQKQLTVLSYKYFKKRFRSR